MANDTTKLSVLIDANQRQIGDCTPFYLRARDRNQ